MKRHSNLFLKPLSLFVLILCLTALLVACGECDHQWGEWTVSQAPSCEAAGSQTRTCSACGETQSQSVAATGHQFDTYISCGDATCLSDGTESATCAHCDKTDTRTAANSKNPAKHTSTEIRYESADEESHKAIYACCGAVAETENHHWNNGVTDPSNSQNTLFTCLDCGKTKSVTPEHTHNAQRVPATASNCTTQGNIEHWFCQGCNTRFTTAALTQTITEAETKLPIAHTSQEFEYAINATNQDKHDKKHACCGVLVATEDHNWDGGAVDPNNALNTLFTCLNCGKTKSQPHVHNAQRVPAAASNCTTQGNIEHWYCQGCNTRFTTAQLTQTITEAETKLPIAHTSQTFEYVLSTTNTAKHEKQYACCGAVVATEDHNYEVAGSTAPSCEENGTTLYRCVCGAHYTTDSAEATGHSVVIWNLQTEELKPGTTCTYNQTFTGTCFTCGEPDTKSVETVRHSYVATITAHPTCQRAGSKSYACVCGATPEEPTVTIAINPDAHHWNDGVTEGGVTTYTCLNGCGHTRTAVVYTEPTQSVDKSVLENNEIVLGGISLKLDQTTLGLLEDDPDQAVTVVANPVNASTLPESIRNQLPAGAPIYDFGLSQGGVPITQFGNGRITITLPYELPTDADADCVSVWYINDEGELSFYAATYYETEDGGFVTFEASHFSTYLPGLAPSANACELYGHNYDTKITAPTCTQGGYTEYHCQRCGESLIDDITDALGHLFGVGTGDEPTCMEGSTMVFSCTRTDCDHTEEITLAPVPHSWQYVAEGSTAPTCTEDGISVYRCTNDGCTATKTETNLSYGGHDLYQASAKLADGATSCEDGIVITKKCYRYECQYTETETVTGSHIRIDKYGSFDEHGNPITPETKIMLGDYLDDLGIPYRDEPYLSLIHGCFCGELKDAIQLFNGTSEYDGELLTGDWIYISAMSPSDGTYLLQTQPMMGWDPILQTPIEGPVFKIRLVAKTTRVGCMETFTVTVQIGYDATTGEATETLTYKLYEELRHMNIKSTATVDDPSKSCYENCFDEDHQYIYGIHVTEYCADCQTVIQTYDTAVSTSSSHFFFTKENYEYDCESGNATYYGIRVFINECPCGQIEYRLYTGDCNFTRTTVGTTTIYTCRDCGYIYAEKTEEIRDEENCRYSYTKYLYLDCVNADDVTNCAKTVICRIYDEARHYHTTNETNRDNPAPTDIPCLYTYYSKNVCDKCGEITYLYEGYTTIHDLHTTTASDGRGNVTTTEFCGAEGCGYQSIVIADKNGNVLRDYRVEKDHSREELCISLSTWKLVNGIRREILERNEYYTLDGDQLLRWFQCSYTYRSETDKGCICVTTYTNHEGEYDIYESFFCQFDEEFHQDKTCQQDGFHGMICSICGYREYSYYEESNGHEYFDGACIYCNIPCDHEYDSSGWCPICQKNCEHETFTDGVCNECHFTCSHGWWEEGVCYECGMACTHEYDDFGYCWICRINCEHESFTDSVCDECGMVCDHAGYWNEGVCEKCSAVCDHDYDEEGTCQICWIVCQHDYTEGVCEECGRVCQHAFDREGICYECQMECKHKYDSEGFCPICQNMCSHNYTEGICSVCGRVCMHSFDGEGVCYECGTVCEHEYHGGYCHVCGRSCWHEFENNWCGICGMPCPHDGSVEGEVCNACGAVTCFHSWNEGACETCGTPCIHDYQYGTCNTCHKTCDHETYTDSICDECGMACENHTWADGICEECGAPCQHEHYENGFCQECGEECAHEYENSRCDICNTLCSHEGCSEGELCDKCGSEACFHDWNEGVCRDCNVACPHKFEEGECTTCGKACDHNYTHYGEFSQCEICRKSCHHDELWGDDGVCDECGTECSHEYRSGACITCGMACDHDYEENWCIRCGEPCPHEGYANGEICGDCGATACRHEWDAGMCVHCYINCSHEYVNGTCTICDMTCEHQRHDWEAVCEICGTTVGHSYEEGRCPVCGRHCDHYGLFGDDNVCDECGITCVHESHDWEGMCYLCGAMVGHSYEESYCSTCGKNCEHVDLFGDDNVCDECGITCYHEGFWHSGVCIRCGAVCEHDYESSTTCSICHKTCYHEGLWGEDSVCDECGATCNHASHDENAICTACGKIGEHDYQRGSCSICQKPCQHHWNAEGICDVCQLTCYHDGSWNEGACGLCGFVCAHEYHNWEGVCNICYTYCGHSFQDGWCEGCGNSCPHEKSWVDGVCNVCGMTCIHESHDWEGLCILCGSLCDHSFENGYCYVCSKNCEHLGTFGDDTICDVCGMVCAHESHDWEGICSLCGSLCDHTYENGYCSVCSRNCEHLGTFGDDSICDLCGMECFHGESWYEGTCGQCGFVCTHESHDGDGVCYVCYTYCGHSYEGGMCSGCGNSCPHDYSFGDGVCSLCGMECLHDSHDYEGNCYICGAFLGHAYENGYCHACGRSCEHMDSFGGDNVCDVCGMECMHDGSYGNDVCYVCGTVLQ